MAHNYDSIIKQVINVAEDDGSGGARARSPRQMQRSPYSERGERGRVDPNVAFSESNAPSSGGRRRMTEDEYGSQPGMKTGSVIEWFDKSMEEELKKRRDDPTSPKLTIVQQTGTGHPLMAESSASGIAVQAALRGERDTELLEAVDKFAKAEAIVAFEGAVRAAEEAAACAPPGCAEEAAVAGARGYQAELTGVIKQKVPGTKPVEVIGYVGITRPKFAKKRTPRTP